MCVFVAKGGLATASVVRNGVGVRDEQSHGRTFVLVQLECLVSPSPSPVSVATRSCCFRVLSMCRRHDGPLLPSSLMSMWTEDGRNDKELRHYISFEVRNCGYDTWQVLVEHGGRHS